MNGNDTARRSECGAKVRPQAVAPVNTGELTPADQGFPMLTGMGIARGRENKSARACSTTR